MKKVLFILIVSFLALGTIRAQENYWTPDGVTGPAVLTVWGEVFIDGVSQTSGDIEIAMFFNGSCRSTTRISGYFSNSFYRVQCNGQSPEAGQTVTFKCYDHATGTEYDACPYTCTSPGASSVVGAANNPVALEFTSASSGTTYPWIPAETQYVASMIAIVQLNGVTIQDGTNWDVGAFCGDVCRGVGNIENNAWVPDEDSYYMFLTINGQDGEEISFKLYDRTAGDVYPGVCDSIVIWEQSVLWGDFTNPYILNFVTEQTFTKDITPYGNGTGNYYLLASPIGEVNPAEVDGLTSNTYDLYYFDQSADEFGNEWINYNHGDSPFNLLPGKGYLYANSGDGSTNPVTLTFTGTPIAGSEYEVKLDYDDNADCKGWNLVGNPFAQTAYIDRPFYVMNEYGTEIILADTTAINAMEGVFVKATGNGETMTFSTEEPTKNPAVLVMNVRRDRGSVIDRAIIDFNEGLVLPKFMLNENSTKLSFVQEDTDYAVVRGNDQGEMPVNFKASEDGSYTINVNLENVEIGYLHLIDNMTNADIDLLQTPSYTFEASSTDPDSRFTLVFSKEGNYWTPDGVTGPAVLTVWGEVFIDGVSQTSGDIEIAMFFNGSCRSTTRISGYFSNSFYRVQCNGQSPEAGQTVTFKCYDHATGTEYDACPYTCTSPGASSVVGAANNPVALEFTSASSGTTYPWIPAETQYVASMIAIVQLNGVTIQDGTNWDVGAFCGDVCRGVGNIENNAWVPDEDSYYMFLTINGQDGEEISFKLYDRTAGDVYPGVCDSIVIWEQSVLWGDFTNPYILNFVTEQTFTKDITPYGNGTGNYYLLASPIGEVNPAEVDGLTSNTYDLYYFDQSADEFGNEWINYNHGDSPFNLLPGKGYLYANSGDGSTNPVTLTFTGTPIAGSEYEVKLDYDDNADCKGWNLVGNPFAQTAYIDRPFYVMNEGGTEIILADTNAINAMEGVFVKATRDKEPMTFSTEEPTKNPAALVMNVTRDRGSVIDRAIVHFNENLVLPKFMLNENSTKLCIQKNDQNFAVVKANEEDELPVIFKANSNGNYTISVSSMEVNFDYLHLIDNQTGTDVDLLTNPSYNFNAGVNDSANRFSLRFKANTNVNTSEDFNPITYRHDGQLSIIGLQGNSELQVIDILGRVLSSKIINGDFNQIINATSGVYVIRVVNDQKTYTQKIVVE